MSAFGELRPTSINGFSNLNIVDTIAATQVVASNLYTTAQTDALVATISGNTDAIQGALDAKQDTTTASTPIACGALVVTGPIYETSFRTGSSATYMKVVDGHHLDVYSSKQRGAYFQSSIFHGRKWFRSHWQVQRSIGSKRRSNVQPAHCRKRLHIDDPGAGWGLDGAQHLYQERGGQPPLDADRRRRPIHREDSRTSRRLAGSRDHQLSCSRLKPRSRTS